MGGGALIQLIAFGVQDIQLIGEPQITYYKCIYRRYTNFSIESIQQDIIGALNPGTKVSVTFARNGDLLKGITLQYSPNKIVPPQNNNKINIISSNLGHVIFKTMELEIGGQIIDRHYSNWLTVWRDLSILSINETQLAVGNNGREPFASIIYNRTAYTHFLNIHNDGDDYLGTTGAPSEAYVPMQFWFCKNPGLALPLIALQYHEVKLHLTLADKENIINCETFNDRVNAYVDLTSIKVFAEYYYLDTIERKQFAQNSHEYLIEQLQYQNYNDAVYVNNTVSIPLVFQHPVKEIIFCGQPPPEPYRLSTEILPICNKGPAFPNNIVYKLVNNVLYKNSETTNVKMNLTFNQLPRFSVRNLKYFTRQQIWQHHTGAGSYNLSDSIGVYSFSLRPEEDQPSGSCNFSRITNPRMVFSDFTKDNITDTFEFLSNIDIYATNYNILRIGSGMAALAFAN